MQSHSMLSHVVPCCSMCMLCMPCRHRHTYALALADGLGLMPLSERGVPASLSMDLALLGRRGGGSAGA